MRAEFSAEMLAGAPPWGVCNPTTSPQPLISSGNTGKALPILEFPHLQNRLRGDQKTYLEVLSSL